MDRKGDRKNMKKIIYTASYTQDDRNAVGGKVTLKFVGKGMQMEFKDLDDLINQCKELQNKLKDRNVTFTIYKHEVEKQLEF